MTTPSYDAGYTAGRTDVTCELISGTWTSHPKGHDCERCVTVRAVLAHCNSDPGKWNFHTGPVVNMVFRAGAPTS